MRGESQGGAKGLQEEVSMGAVESLPVGTVAEQEGGLRASPGQLWAFFPPGAQAGHRQGSAICEASRLSWPYKFFVTRWVL